MNENQIEKIKKESKAVREAIKEGIPEKKAVKIYLDANNKVKDGRWIEIYKTDPSYATSDEYKHAGLVYRYWGPQNIIEEELTKKGKAVTPSALERLCKEKALIGKTHEIVLGSKEYGDIPNLSKGTYRQYKKTEDGWKRKELQGKIPQTKPKGAEPPPGSRIQHSHWEIKQMYEGIEEKKAKNIKSLGFGFLILFGCSSAYYLLNYEPKLTGYAITKIESGSIYVPLILVGILALISAIVIIKKFTQRT